MIIAHKNLMPTGKWQCSACGFMNDAEVDHCDACNTNMDRQKACPDCGHLTDDDGYTIDNRGCCYFCRAD